MSAGDVLTGTAIGLVVLALTPAVLAVARGSAVARLAALNLVNIVAVLLLAVLAEVFQRPAYLDVALVLAVVAFSGSLIYARFLERWL